MSNKDLWLSGLTMGLTGKGVPELSGKCLYNGVELPELPIADKYQYHIIRQDNTNNRYDAIYATSNFYMGNDGIQVINMSTTVVYSMPLSKSSDWEYRATYPNSSYGFDENRILVYSNADVYTSVDMTEVYFAASEPVPVVDTFTSGYLLGAELRGDLRSRGTSVIYANGTLYIKNSPAIQHGSILEVK